MALIVDNTRNQGIGFPRKVATGLNRNSFGRKLEFEHGFFGRVGDVHLSRLTGLVSARFITQECASRINGLSAHIVHVDTLGSVLIYEELTVDNMEVIEWHWCSPGLKAGARPLSVTSAETVVR